MSDRDTRSDAWGKNTRWTVVRRAAGSDEKGVVEPEVVGQAWEELIERYREPVRAAVRRQLSGHPDAEQISDDFFAYLFSQDLLSRAEPGKGRFRAFMQGVIRRYAKSAARQNRPQGGNLDDAPPPALEDENRLEAREEADWALGVLRNASRKLTEESPRDGELLLRSQGIPPFEATTREALMEEYGLKPNALKQAIHRARQRLKALIALEIRDTVDGEDELEDEVALIRERIVSAKPDIFDEIEDD